MLSAVHSCGFNSSIRYLVDRKYDICMPESTTTLPAEVMFKLTPQKNCGNKPMTNLHVIAGEDDSTKCQVYKGLFFSDEHWCSGSTMTSCRVMNPGASVSDCEIQCRCQGVDCTVSFVIRPKFQNEFNYRICEILHSSSTT